MKVVDLFLNISINILLFIVIATSEFSFEHIYLFLLGIALNALPVLLGRLISNTTISENLFLAGTYGGGNRGVFLVSFFLPAMLFEFMIMDLGNYFSLLLISPMMFRKRYFDKKNLFLMSLAVIAVVSGIYVNKYNVPCSGCSQIKSIILYAIMIYTVLQILQWVRSNKQGVLFDIDMVWFFGTRIVIIGSLLILYYFITLKWATTLFIFIILPTSSLLFVFFSRQDHIYERVVKNTVVSMLIYFAAVIALLLIKGLSS